MPHFRLSLTKNIACILLKIVSENQFSGKTYFIQFIPALLGVLVARVAALVPGTQTAARRQLVPHAGLVQGD